MNLLIINNYGQQEVVRDAKSIPRIGESIDMFYKPLPIVQDVVMWPRKESLGGLGYGSDTEIEAIIFVG